MKKQIFAAFIAFMAVMLVSVVSAAPLADNVNVEVNGIELGPNTNDVSIAGMAGEVVPVEITFDAMVDSSDVKVEVEIYGGRNTEDAETGRFTIVDGSKYKKLLSLQLPTDLKDVTKDLTLEITIRDANNSNDNVYETYVIKMQRESYEFDILSVDHSLVVDADEIVPVSVVVKNTGFERSDDVFVVVSVPELGIRAKGYMGDLVADEPVDDEEDSAQKVLYLRIPANAEAGVYELNVEVYNSDSVATVSKAIKVDGETEETTLNADDAEAEDEVAMSVVIWTIVLVVIFVVLLAILVALLMKKDKPIEEVETSYY